MSDPEIPTADRPLRLSPNQRAKREALIVAAIGVLRTRGLAGCTSRAIADASGCAKSALHYYFRDTEEIVALAFQRLMTQYIERIRAAADDAPDPNAALWAATSTYLHLGATQHSDQLPMLWFEVQLAASRCGDTAALSRLTAQTTEMLSAIVAATGATAPAATARVLLASLVGILVRDALEPVDLDEALRECLHVLGFAWADGKRGTD
ncbi:MAG: TetR/AcrR family transcriptional regulator [Gammaproteobacteria bacterium]|jgi:AcrR family transcriptional regulator